MDKRPEIWAISTSIDGSTPFAIEDTEQEALSRFPRAIALGYLKVERYVLAKDDQ